jgi:hypothetical protein
LSNGQTLPAVPPDHRRREYVIRPLTDSVLRRDRPLFSSGFPVASFGGKNRLLGVGSHLHGHFKGLSSQVRKYVPHLHLRTTDHMARGGVVHRVGHRLHNLPAFRLHAFDKLVRIHGH